jgi:Amt family ammonium transporter
MEQSSSQRARWLHDFPERPLDLSVNVSGRQLLSNGFCGTVENTLSATGMAPAALILELTENVLIEDNERAMTVLTDLKALGVRLALDDFGTGFSSLSYLRRLPVDIVKIDRLFVSDIAKRPQSGAIVKAVTDLTHALGLTAVAEGIETRTQRDRISHLGCDSSQGYYYAKPMSASAFTKQLATSTMYPLRLPRQRAAAGSMPPNAR